MTRLLPAATTALVFMSCPAMAQVSFLKPKPAPAAPAPKPATPAPKAAAPSAKAQPPASAPTVAAPMPAKVVSAGKNGKASRDKPAGYPAPIAAELATVARDCAGQGALNSSQAVIKGDFNGDGLTDYLLYYGYLACGNDNTYFQPTARTGQPLSLYAGERGGGVHLAVKEDQVMQLEMKKQDGRVIPVMTFAGVRCGDTRQDVTTAEMMYCEQQPVYQNGEWRMVEDPATVAAREANKKSTAEWLWKVATCQIPLGNRLDNIQPDATTQNGRGKIYKFDPIIEYDGMKIIAVYVDPFEYSDGYVTRFYLQGPPITVMDLAEKAPALPRKKGSVKWVNSQYWGMDGGAAMYLGTPKMTTYSFVKAPQITMSLQMSGAETYSTGLNSIDCFNPPA